METWTSKQALDWLEEEKCPEALIAHCKNHQWTGKDLSSLDGRTAIVVIGLTARQFKVFSATRYLLSFPTSTEVASSSSSSSSTEVASSSSSSTEVVTEIATNASTVEKVDCSLCMDTVDQLELFPGCQDHSCCKQCLERYLDASIDHEAKTIKCFEHGCASSASIDDDLLRRLKLLGFDKVCDRMVKLKINKKASESVDSVGETLGWMRCPGCNVMVEKSEACNHMTHANCQRRDGTTKTEFCYCCGMELLTASIDVEHQTHYPFGSFKSCRIKPQVAAAFSLSEIITRRHQGVLEAAPTIRPYDIKGNESVGWQLFGIAAKVVAKKAVESYYAPPAPRPAAKKEECTIC